MRKQGQVTRETVCYLKSVFIVTLLEGMMTQLSVTPHTGDQPPTLPHLPEAGKGGTRLNRRVQLGKDPPQGYNFHTPVQMCDFYIIFKC